MVISQAAFTLNDTLVKVATATLGIGQIMFVRGMFATLLIGLVVWKSGHWRPLRSLERPIVSRIVGEIGGTVFYLIALANMPLANVSAVFQALPLAVTMSAALFLGEPVGPRRWLAITAGFIGVLIIVRPGFDGFNAYSVCVLLCVACCAFRDLSTRRISDSVPSTFVAALTAGAITICGAFLVPSTGGWNTLSAADLLVLFGAALLVLTGYLAIILCMRTGEISFVAPLRYTALLWAIAAGYLVFSSVPDLPMLVGSAIVVASGVYTLYRERVVGRRKLAAESTGPAMPPDGI